MKHVDLPVRFSKHDHRGGGGLHARSRRAHEVERCLNCDVQTHFTDSLCIECDACIDICPTDCLTIVPERRRSRAAHAADGAGDEPRSAAVRVGRRSSRPAA